MATRDLQLAEICHQCLASGDAQAWVELISRLQPLFARIAYRVTDAWGHVQSDEIDDIIQDIFLKLGARGGAALRGLPLDDEARTHACLKTIAANAALDFCKARCAAKRGADKTVSVEALGGALMDALGTDQKVETQILMREVDSVLPHDKRERAIFWLYYRQGFTAREIASMAGVGLTAKGVESLIYRLTQGVRAALGPIPSGTEQLEKGERASPAS